MNRNPTLEGVTRLGTASALVIATRLESALAHISWNWWQVPPRLQRRDALVKLTITHGLDGAGCALLAHRWFLLARILAVIAPWFFIGAVIPLIAAGVLLEILAATAAARGLVRYRQMVRQIAPA